MSFVFKCSHCGTDLEAEEEWIGMESECPICGRETEIPPSEPIAEHSEQEDVPMRKNILLNNLRKLPKKSTADSSHSEIPRSVPPYSIPPHQKPLGAIPPPASNPGIHSAMSDFNAGDDSIALRKRIAKIVLMLVILGAVVAAAVVFGLTRGASDKTNDQGWATDEETQKPPKPVREITVTAVVSLASLRYFNFTDSFCNIKIYAGKELVHQGSRQFSAKTEYEARVTVPYGSILSATIKPDNQSEFKEMNRAKNVYEDLVIGTDMSSSDNYIGGLLGEHPLAAVEDGGKVYIECGKLYKE